MENRRILIIDDDLDVWKAYEIVLSPPDELKNSASRKMAELLTDSKKEERPVFDLHYAAQGQAGFALVHKALDEDRPYAVAFIDIRMPPGWDGMETAARIRQIDPKIEIVIVTAYSDRSREEIVQNVGAPDKLLFLRKPFDPDELTQLALSLTSKWNLAQKEETAKKELEESRTRLQTLVENTSDLVWEMDTRGVFLYCSPVCEYIYGFRPEELEGNSFIDCLLAPEEVEKARQLLRSCVMDFKGYFGVERLCLKKDGSKVFIESSASQIFDERGRVVGFRGIDRDISRRKNMEVERARLEEQIRQSEKMQALGTLAGGVAHDLNNILTPIMANAQLVMMRQGPDHPETPRLLEIQKSAEKAASLIRQILTFSRKQIIKEEVLSLNQIIDNIYKMLRRLIRTDIEFHIDLDKDLWTVDGDIAQIEQIIVNLIVNAQDALPEGGNVIVRTWNEESRDGSEFDIFHKPIDGSFVVLSVSDNGIGMDEITQDLIFDPFFTTKEVGKGTGLGLSTVYGSVSQHRGHIRLDSSPGNGTIFYIYFKKSKKQSVVDDAQDTLQIGGGSETILLVEDNSDVRMVTASVLEQYGYRVLMGGNGIEALQILSEYDGEIDLLLTDLVMPVLGGKALAQKVRSSDPDIPILLMSAYQINVDEIAPTTSGFDFIQKPFTPLGLAQIVRDLLDEAEGRNLPEEAEGMDDAWEKKGA